MWDKPSRPLFATPTRPYIKTLVKRKIPLTFFVLSFLYCTENNEKFPNYYEFEPQFRVVGNIFQIRKIATFSTVMHFSYNLTIGAPTSLFVGSTMKINQIQWFQPELLYRFYPSVPGEHFTQNKSHRIIINFMFSLLKLNKKISFKTSLRNDFTFRNSSLFYTFRFKTVLTYRIDDIKLDIWNELFFPLRNGNFLLRTKRLGLDFSMPLGKLDITESLFYEREVNRTGIINKFILRTILKI